MIGTFSSLNLSNDGGIKSADEKAWRCAGPFSHEHQMTTIVRNCQRRHRSAKSSSGRRRHDKPCEEIALQWISGRASVQLPSQRTKRDKQYEDRCGGNHSCVNDTPP